MGFSSLLLRNTEEGTWLGTRQWSPISTFDSFTALATCGRVGRAETSPRAHRQCIVYPLWALSLPLKEL